MIKCSICNRRWFFSSKVKCNCKAEQLKVHAAALPVRRSIQNNNDNDIALFAMHQQETLKQQYSDFSEPCRTELPSSSFRSFDLSPPHCNSSHDSSYESSSSYDSGSTSSSSWD